MLRDLLLYLWQNRHTELTEYQLGIEILGRRSDFDPKTDATVRVNIGRLRQRLASYYEVEGKDDPVRLSIPVGVYRVCYAKPCTPEPPPAIEAAVVPDLPGRQWPWRNIALALTAALLLLAIHDFSTWRTLQHSVPALHPFWSDALGCRQTYSIIVPSPQFFRWRQPGFVARDFKVNAHDGIAESQPLQLLRERWGEPESTDLYTVTTDTLASGEIARYLQDRGVRIDIRTKTNVSQSLIEERDSILMFAAANAAQYEPFIQPLTFRFETPQLRNLKPRPGEPQGWSGQTFSQDHSISYGLLASVPSRTGQTRQLVLASSHNNALAALLTSEPLLHEAFEYWKRHGSPESFEMVIRLEVKSITTLRADPVALHAWAPVAASR